MSRTAPPSFSFSSGEISPLLYGRPDFQRYVNGLRLCSGHLPFAEGPVTRAPGTRYIGPTRNNLPAHLVPFIFSQTEARMLEFTELTFRVWNDESLIQDGGTPLVVNTPYKAARFPFLRLASSGDRIYCAEGTVPIQRLSRFSDTNWTIEDFPFQNGPFQQINSDDETKVEITGVTGSVSILANQNIFVSGDVGSFFFVEPANLDDVPYFTGDTSVTVGDKMRFDGVVYELTGFDGGATSGNTGVNPPTHREGKALTQKGGPIWTAIHTGSGILKITAVVSAQEATASVLSRLPDDLTDTETPYWRKGAWSNAAGWPAAVCFHEERFMAAATSSQPQTVWASTQGDFPDFKPSTDADGSFGYTLAASQLRVNSIQWLLSNGRAVYAGTVGEGNIITSRSTETGISPTTIKVEADSSEGFAALSPVQVDGAPIAVTRDLRRLLQITYDYGYQKADPTEITRPFRHIFDSEIVQIAWLAIPFRAVIAVLGNGDLAFIAHDQKEDQLGAARISLAGGKAKSVAIIPQNNGREDEVWLCVERDGQYGIEVLEPLFSLLPDRTVEDARHLYAAVSYDGAATGTISGLGHLEGQPVYCWSAAGAIGPLTVTGGAVTLPDGATVTKAVTGLHDPNHMIATLPITSGARDGGSTGRQKRIAAVGLYLLDTAGLEIRTVNQDGVRIERTPWEDALPRLQDPFGAPELFTGMIDVPLSAKWAKSTWLEIRPRPGAPFTLLSMTPIQHTADS